MLTVIVRFVNIILAALLAGTSFGIWVGFNPENYTASTYLEQQKALVMSLNTSMIVLVVGATILTFVSAYLHRKNKAAYILLLLAAASFASCMLITRLGNVPVQNEILTWNINAIPENWTILRNEWWSYHIMRTIAELVALIIIAWVYAKKMINN